MVVDELDGLSVCSFLGKNFLKINVGNVRKWWIVEKSNLFLRYKIRKL